MPSSSLLVSHPDPSMISRENWDTAEGWTNELLCRIRPTVAADRNRRDVFEYVRGVITGSFDCKVVPYGSVPFKTYLPDGDIDLTAISTPNVGSTLSSDVYAVLKGEEHNKSSNFEVKDVHFIDAEVKLVKCLVKNIVVDISFNQFGGLSKLCFLEKVDDLIGKNHLFKRSIILIKAWCYYESRILGAHHGLISTYALETLVLHVFHLFHSSLNGPLAVLYRFLDYFGKFDWENYCVSVSGPVCKSSLSDVAAKVPENGRNKLLLSEEFLQDCVDKFSVPSKGIETNSRAFPQKNLNIIDALKENNNLGRSVNRGNFYRIRSAFKYAASKLGQILLSPRERIADEINSFFANTLERNETVASNAECSDTSREDSMFLKATAGDHNDKILSSRNGNKLSSMLPPKFVASNDMSFAHRPESEEKSLVASNSVGSYRNNENVAPNRLVVSIPAHNMSEKSSSAVRERNSASNLGNSAPLNSLLDLSGQYESYFSILMSSQNYQISSPALPSPVSNQLLSKNILKSTQQSPPVEPKACSEMKASGDLGTQSHPVNPPIPSNASIRSEEQKKSEGIGTYFPKMKHHSNRDQPSSRRRRFPASGGRGQLWRHAHESSLATAPTEMNLSGEVRLKLSSQEEYPVLGNVKYTASDFQLHLPSVWGSSNSRDLAHTSETNESRLHQLKLSEVSMPEESSYLSSETGSLDSTSGRAVPMVRNPSALAGSNEERVAEPAFHLKNEVDFPPLSIKRMVKA